MTFNKSHLILLLMVVSSLLGMSLRPTHLIINDVGRIKLETLIPQNFGDWHVENMAAMLVNPEAQSAIKAIYAQTLSRTYVNNNGDRIMLSMAYGEDQSDSVGAHLPEGCYGGQGFVIQKTTPNVLATSYIDIPITRVLATKSERIEPITYWLKTGHQLSYPGWPNKVVKLKYALQGSIPDGLLMRVSNITISTETGDVNAAYALHDQFIKSLLASMTQKDRWYLIGQSKD